MSLQFIIGNSGAGKSYAAYQNVICEASRNPANYVLCNRSGAVYHADAENTRGNASAKRNFKY